VFGYEVVQRAFANDLTPLFAPVPIATSAPPTNDLTPLFS